jgi:hypothetical protein
MNIVRQIPRGGSLCIELGSSGHGQFSISIQVIDNPPLKQPTGMVNIMQCAARADAFSQ